MQRAAHSEATTTAWQQLCEQQLQIQTGIGNAWIQNREPLCVTIIQFDKIMTTSKKLTNVQIRVTFFKNVDANSNED